MTLKTALTSQKFSKAQLRLLKEFYWQENLWPGARGLRWFGPVLLLIGLLSDQSFQQGDSLQKFSEVAQENMDKANVNRLNLGMLWSKLPREVTQ